VAAIAAAVMGYAAAVREPTPTAASPLTVDRAARTVEVIWSTGVRSRNFVQPHGWIMEELDMAPSAVRMDVLRSGRAPVLDTHRRDGAEEAFLDLHLAQSAVTLQRHIHLLFDRDAHRLWKEKG
jgi:hypothetical protein